MRASTRRTLSSVAMTSARSESRRGARPRGCARFGGVWVTLKLYIYSPPVTEPIAIIGATGALGFGLTLRWGRAGVPVVLGSRDAARAVEAADRARAALPDGHFEGFENAEAAAKAEVVVLLRTLPQPVRDADQPQGRAARAPARRRRDGAAGRRGRRPARVLGCGRAPPPQQAQEWCPTVFAWSARCTP